MESLTFAIYVLGNYQAFTALKITVETNKMDWNNYHILHAYCAFASVADLKRMFERYPNTNIHVEDDLPFKLAVMYNTLDVVQYMVQTHGPFEILDRKWPTYNNDYGHSLNVLVCAVKNGSLDLVKYVLATFPSLCDEMYAIESIQFYYNNKPIKEFFMEQFPQLPVIDWSDQEIAEVSSSMDIVNEDVKKIMMRIN